MQVPAQPVCADTTGLVLAGGRGSRMGGVDKGLQTFNGVPLALHALCRLQPLVSRAAISANRNLAAYADFGVPVWPDAADWQDFAGPLAGFLTGLLLCETPFLLTVPCDAPLFPVDLAQRLAQALAQNKADTAYAADVAADGTVAVQPAFCLMLASPARRSLHCFVQGGGRSIRHWLAGQQAAEVRFDALAGSTANAFANINTLAELEALQALQNLQPIQQSC